MADTSAPAKNAGKICYVTEKNILIPGFFLMLLTAAVLFAALVLISFTKVKDVMESRAQWLVQSAAKAQSSSDRVMDSMVKHYAGVLEYLIHYQSIAEIDDRELEAYANKTFDTADFFVLQPDGRYAYPEGKKEDAADDLDSRQLMLNNYEPLFLYSNNNGAAVYYPLPSGNYLMAQVLEEQVDRRLLNLSVSSVIASLRYYEDNELNDNKPTGFAFLTYRSEDGSEVYAMDATGYYDGNPNEPGVFRDSEGKIVDFNVEALSTLFGNRDNADHVYCNVKYYGSDYFALVTFVDDQRTGGKFEYYYCLNVFSEVPTILHILVYTMLGFSLILAIVILFIYYLRQYSGIQKKIRPDYVSVVKDKTRIIPIVGIVFVGILTYYAQTLFSLSVYVLDDSQDLSEIREYYDDAANEAKKTEKEVKTQYLECAASISDLLRISPERGDRMELSKAASMLGLKAVILYDENGVMTVSSGDYTGLKFGAKEGEDRYQFNQLKNGYSYVFISPQKNQETGETTQQLAVHRYDREGNNIGFTEIVYATEELATALYGGSIQAVLENTAIPRISQTACIDPKTGLMVYYPNLDYIDWPAEEVGFTAESMKSGYFGKIRLLDIPYYVQNTVIGDYLVYVITQESLIYKNRLPFAALSVGLFLIDFFILLFFIREKRQGYDEVIFASERTFLEILDLVGEPQRDADAKAKAEEPEYDTGERRMSSFRQNWIMMTPERKIASILKTFWGLGAVLVVVLIALRSASTNTSNLLMRIASGSWPRGLNVFSATACILLVLVSTVAVGFVLWVLDLIARVSNPRGETICRLLSSFTEYVSLIIIIFVCLTFLGVDTKTIAASAGIMGLMIGMGSKDLVTDILAGLFIIFEGTFQVGDIVDIGGYTGMVKEIGIRTTKVCSWKNNVKIINNRNVTNVVNMTMRDTFAVVDFSVPSTVSMETLENIFREEFKDYKKKYQELIGTPFFKGINKITGNKIECRVVAEVPEIARGNLERKLSKDIIDILEKNNIPMN